MVPLVAGILAKTKLPSCRVMVEAVNWPDLKPTSAPAMAAPVPSWAIPITVTAGCASAAEKAKASRKTRVIFNFIGTAIFVMVVVIVHARSDSGRRSSAPPLLQPSGTRGRRETAQRPAGKSAAAGGGRPVPAPESAPGRRERFRPPR